MGRCRQELMHGLAFLWSSLKFRVQGYSGIRWMDSDQACITRCVWYIASAVSTPWGELVKTALVSDRNLRDSRVVYYYVVYSYCKNKVKKGKNMLGIQTTLLICFLFDKLFWYDIKVKTIFVFLRECFVFELLIIFIWKEKAKDNNNFNKESFDFP